MCKEGTCACKGIPLIDTDDPVYQAKTRFWSNGINDLPDVLISDLLMLQQRLCIATKCQSMDLVGFVIGEVVNARGWMFDD